MGGSDQRRDLVDFGCSVADRPEVGQRWAQEDQSEASAVIQVRDDGGSDQEGSNRGGETQGTVWR